MRSLNWGIVSVFTLLLVACASESVPETRMPSEACVQDDPMFVAYNDCQADQAFDQFHLMRNRESEVH